MKDEIQILKKLDELRQISMLMINRNQNQLAQKPIESSQYKLQTEPNIEEFESLPDDFKLDDDNDLNKSLSNFKDELIKMKNIRIKTNIKDSKKDIKEIIKDKIKKIAVEMCIQTDNPGLEDFDEKDNINVLMNNPITKEGKFACWLCYKIANKEDAVFDTTHSKVSIFVFIKLVVL